MVRVSVVLNQLMLHFNKPDHGILQHLFQQDPFLGVHHLVITVLQLFESFDIFYVKQ